MKTWSSLSQQQDLVRIPNPNSIHMLEKDFAVHQNSENNLYDSCHISEEELQKFQVILFSPVEL